MRRFIAMNYMIGMAIKKAMQFDIKNIKLAVNAAFADVPECENLKMATELGLLEVYRQQANEMCVDKHFYYQRVGNKLIPLKKVYSVCPNCGKPVSIDLNTLIADGCIYSEHMMCDACKEELENGK